MLFHGKYVWFWYIYMSIYGQLAKYDKKLCISHDNYQVVLHIHVAALGIACMYSLSDA